MSTFTCPSLKNGAVISQHKKCLAKMAIILILLCVKMSCEIHVEDLLDLPLVLTGTDTSHRNTLRLKKLASGSKYL